MFDNFGNSIRFKTIAFKPTSVIPIARLNEFRTLLRTFQIDWEVVLVRMYPHELKKLSNEFPEFNFRVLNERSNDSNTIFLGISKILN